jgi:diguanylate cyclase (GGDEF)-like protein
LLYNALLFASLRRWRYLAYAGYLASYLVLNLSYTGHLFAWAWPTAVAWQLWSNPTLMLLCSFAGLTFGMVFLETWRHFPRLHKTVVWFIGTAAALGAVLAATNTYPAYILLAFVVVLVFSILMLTMGIVAVAAGHVPARYFLAAAFLAMIGAAMTALAVWGFIPYNVWTFRFFEVGMLVDAVLLALALAQQFRAEERERFRALQMAKIDPLTRINNRRAFYSVTHPLWRNIQRHGRAASVVLIDIDRFKSINDTFGHAAGDEVLVHVARTLLGTARESDVCARWGGEEFILFLPETGLEDARLMAERVRAALAALTVETAAGPVRLTASAGVAEQEVHHRTLEDVIGLADLRLYQAKQAGRDRVCCGAPAGRTPMAPAHGGKGAT